MSIYAIADIHLSGNPPTKPMEIFGQKWENHWGKIKTSWAELIQPDDYVLLAGDMSWALKLDEALIDLQALMALPGKKIMIKGNHDYWWQSLKKMNIAVNNEIFFIQNNYAVADNFAICGSRGWVCPDDPFFTAEDEPLYRREVSRVRTSLTAAKQAGFTDIILMLHYPPQYSKPNDFTALIEEFNVKICVYGHLHGETAQDGPQGYIKSTACYLVACDALNFKFKKII